SDVSDGNTCPEIITRTYNIADDCGNQTLVTQTITVDDNIAPAFTAPADVEIYTDASCNYDISVANTGDVTDEADNCSTGIEATYTDSDPVAGPCEGTFVITRTWSLVDNCGNAAENQTQTITVSDDTAPIIDNTNTNNIEIECGIGDTQTELEAWLNSNAGAIASDNCSTVTWTNDYGSDTSVQCDNGAITVTFTATDVCGNSSTTTATYLIKDTTAPIVETTAGAFDATLECSDTDGIAAALAQAPTATDDCSTVTMNLVSDDTTVDPNCPNAYVQVRVWNFTDACGNISDDFTQTITVQDTTAPMFVEALPADATVECDAVPTAETLTATDNCGVAIVTYEEVRTDGDCPSSYTLARTWTATDECGLTTVHTQTITVQDTTAPVFVETLPADATVECDAVPTADTLTATDNCGAAIVTYEEVRTDGSCPSSYTLARTWTATDECGLTTVHTQTITVQDITAPAFVETLPADAIVECDAVPTAETLTATDNCGAAIVTYEEVRTDGDCPSSYSLARTWTATDECGLTTVHTQTITVQDTTAPVFVETLPNTNIMVECDAVPIAETLTATDNCGAATVTFEEVRTDGSCANDYTLTRTWTATDECGITTVFVQNIMVQDTTAPVFVEALPSDITVECDAIPEPETLTATDNCGTANVTVQDEITDGACLNSYIITRTYTAVDECNLITTHVQTITVQDTTAPEVITPFDQNLNVSCADITEVPQLEFSDNCSTDVNVVFNETSTLDPNSTDDYVITRTWTATDSCGNEATFTQVLNVSRDEIITEITAQDRCFDDGIVNLNDILDSDISTTGIWEMLSGDTAATLSSNGVFDPSGLEVSQTFLPSDGGIDYLFRYTTTDGSCINITEITMNINADCVVLPCGENDIEISKAVTPNGDNINDYFYISGIDLCGFEAEVQIFNRWGALIFKSDNYPLINEFEKGIAPPSGSWDGRSPKNSLGNNGRVPNGTYYYIITLKNSGLNPFTGPVYLGTK
ncbi:gliding motility-associated C-terminal domain-containing protein, partial [Gaetbulibacter sp. M240]|uniref:gliding motility-associated C-terminal domain-containing protein n=1 Tax=Gaetbulibacter sp. M240 TaxID=3126511 RepID=UPI00374E6990